MPIATLNPADESVVKTFDEYSDKKVEQIIKNVDKSHQEWVMHTINERAKYIQKIGRELKNQQDELASLITLEMGKPLQQSKAEIKKCASVCQYYAKNGRHFLADINYPSSAAKSFVQHKPLGIILAVMPWNYPFWQVFRFVAPALVAGNAVVLKHASNVPQCALAIEKIFMDSDIPKNLFRVLLLSNKKTEMLLKDNRIKAVTLTGSEKAGSKIGAKAGANIKKSVMELGGSDAFIVTDSADIEQAVNKGVEARYQNTGQSCIAAKRFILVNKIADQFIELFIEKVKSLNLVDPTWDNADLGPMARKDLRNGLHKQVRLSIAKGAKLLLGGKKINALGYYYPATVLDNVTVGMPAYHEELFGPVASIIRVSSIDKAVKIANDSQFGLGSSLWCRDKKEALHYANQIQAGATFINDMVRSDPKLPFGGINKSGFGRELSDIGIKEFVNVKTVYIK